MTEALLCSDSLDAAALWGGEEVIRWKKIKICKMRGERMKHEFVIQVLVDFFL